jgi:hypothetical protein
MKAKLIALLSLAAFAMNASAQGTNASYLYSDSGAASEGFRLSAFTMFPSFKVKASVGGYSGSGSTSLDSGIGASLGYAYLPVQSLGFTTNLGYIQFRKDGDSAGMVRLDGNLAFAASEIIVLKGGLNVSKWTSGTILTEIDPAIGGQAGLGLQVNKNFGVDIAYVLMRQNEARNGAELELQTSGVEIGINGTF